MRNLTNTRNSSILNRTITSNSNSNQGENLTVFSGSPSNQSYISCTKYPIFKNHSEVSEGPIKNGIDGENDFDSDDEPGSKKKRV